MQAFFCFDVWLPVTSTDMKEFMFAAGELPKFQLTRPCNQVHACESRLS